MCRISIKQTALDELSRIPSPMRDRLRVRIHGHADDPRPFGVKKLRGEYDAYRIRVGSYRILYTIDDTDRLVRVSVIDHRKDAYR